MSKLPRKPSRKFEFGEALADVVRDAPSAIRAEKLRPSRASGRFDGLFMGILCCASVSFCVYAVKTSLNDPDYFSQKLISSFQIRDNLDPIMTGTVAAPAGEGSSLPVPTIARKTELKPSDYQIVMVFEGEAILATNDELMRAKVGTVLPGLGAIKEIVPTGTGGTVVAEDATLETAAP